MNHYFVLGRSSFNLPLLVVAAFILWGASTAKAITTFPCPYVTVQTNVPLNQATSDSINGLLPYFNSDIPAEGSIASLTDATQSDSPTDNVIPSPDNTWSGIAWDFGDPGYGHMWRLDRIDLWIPGNDEVRKGIRMDISVSTTGNVNDFSIITNSLEWEPLSTNSLYNYVRYDFPETFVPGAIPPFDKYPVNGFRYLRLNSRGDTFNGVDYQTRFTETDIWVTKVVIPPLISIDRNGSGDVTLTWPAMSGRSYNVDYKNDLNDAWTTLTTVQGEDATKSVTDSSTSGLQRYYRVVLLP